MNFSARRFTSSKRLEASRFDVMFTVHQPLTKRGPKNLHQMLPHVFPKNPGSLTTLPFGNRWFCCPFSWVWVSTPWRRRFVRRHLARLICSLLDQHGVSTNTVIARNKRIHCTSPNVGVQSLSCFSARKNPNMKPDTEIPWTEGNSFFENIHSVGLPAVIH